MFRFLHAADIHLDSPLRGLESYEDAPVDEIRGACRRAFDNLITLAIDTPVDFVLLAGDLYDGDWKDYNTGLFFIDRMARLRRHDIKVIMVSGNHDAGSRISRNLRLPDNVKLFSSRRAESLLLEEIGVKIHGISYQRRAMTDNPVPQYPPADPDYFNIGLLHTALSGRAGHEPYAPCTINDLRAPGYDYWALGHVHQWEEVSREPWIVFSGNIQGRHIRETGAKGAVLVTVGHDRVEQVDFQELDVLRWTFCQVDLSDCQNLEMVEDKVRRAFIREQEQAAGRPLALRLELSGTCPVHVSLQQKAMEQMEIFRGIAIELGSIWLEKIKFKTSSPLDLDDLAADSPVAGLLKNIDQADLSALVNQHRDIIALQKRLPPQADLAICRRPENEELTDFSRRVRELLTAKLIHGAQP